MKARPLARPRLDPPAAGVAPPELLESWKEIATHLKRTVRTVQRWEAFESMPIHRHKHKKRASVFGIRLELDAWRHSRRADLFATRDAGRLTRPPNLAIDSGLASAMAWVWVDADPDPPRAMTIMEYRAVDSRGPSGWRLFRMPDGRAAICLAAVGPTCGGPVTTLIEGSARLTAGHWHDVAFARNERDVTLYVDGHVEGTGMFDGGRPNLENFNCKAQLLAHIDQVRRAVPASIPVATAIRIPCCWHIPRCSKPVTLCWQTYIRTEEPLRLQQPERCHFSRRVTAMTARLSVRFRICAVL